MMAMTVRSSTRVKARRAGIRKIHIILCIS
jgi:hypothetical protein